MLKQQATPSTIQETIKETPVSSLILLTSTIYQSQIQATPSTTQETIKETPVSSLILLTTTVQIRETVNVMPNVKEMDCKMSSIIGGFIGFVLGAVVVITICIIIVCVFFTLKKTNIILSNPNYQDVTTFHNKDAFSRTLNNDLYSSAEQTGREEYPVDKNGEENINRFENCYEMQDTSDYPKESKPITEMDILPNDSTYNTLLRSASPILPMTTNDQYSQIKAVFQPVINQTSQQQEDYNEIYSTVDN